MSKWLVGSSNSKQTGCKKRARAKLTRIRHPPEKSLVSFDCISCVKPKPRRMLRARTSAVAASRASNRSYTPCKASIMSSCCSSRDRAPASSPSPDSPPAAADSASSVNMWLRSSATCSRRMRSSSTDMTASKAVTVSDGSTSWSKKKISIPRGMGTARAPNALSKVDLPHPFRPTNPYRLPWLRTMSVSSSNTCPMCCRVKLVTLMSRLRASTPFRDAAYVQMVPPAAKRSAWAWSTPSSTACSVVRAGAPPSVPAPSTNRDTASAVNLVGAVPSPSSPLPPPLALRLASRAAFA